MPPPLISYKRYNLDLNTISCSGSQPHYIALGGAHLHCFLHDRRMLGRDRLAERGSPGGASSAASMSSHEDETMGQATQCVRKFAPNGRGKMRRRDNGHITACKISDAYPNEMIASWSGDHIYSFDIVRSPDAGDQRGDEGAPIGTGGQSRPKESRDRKPKRKKAGSSTSTDGAKRGVSKPRRAMSETSEAGEFTVRVRYENGQSEDIAMNDPVAIPLAIVEEARESVLSESQKRSMQIAKSTIRIRKLMFSLDASSRQHGGSPDLSAHKPSFTLALGLAATCLPEMDEIMTSWGYPLNPDREDIKLQQTLRANRDSSRRFVQAAGTLSHLLGGKLQTAGHSTSPALQLFEHISSASPGPHTSSRETFSYDFLKAITLWLAGGKQALLQGFKRPPNQRNENPRFPIPEEAEQSGIDKYLIPYLLHSARESPIPDVDASRFEVDNRRKAFRSESAAVIAFSSAIRMPLEDLSRAIMPNTPANGGSPANGDATPIPVAQDRMTALKFWAFKVGRGVLLNACEGVTYQFVDTAFGGLGIPQPEEGRVQEDIDPDEIDDVVDGVSVVRRPLPERRDVQSASQNCEVTPEPRQHEPVNQDRPEDQTSRATCDFEMGGVPPRPRSIREPTVELDEAGSETEMVLVEDLHQEIVDQLAEDDEDGDEDAAEEDADEDSEDEEDDDITAEERQFMFQSAADRGKMRESVEAGVPCYTHSREYRGHCNVRTVKDCNFFGLQDEYVVSGSDSGHLFIWVECFTFQHHRPYSSLQQDKKTSQLVNILEGDGEVVNVVQGPSSIPSHNASPVLLLVRSSANPSQAIPTSPSSQSPASTTPSRSSPPTPALRKTPASASTTPRPAVPQATRPSPADDLVPNPPLPTPNPTKASQAASACTRAIGSRARTMLRDRAG